MVRVVLLTQREPARPSASPSSPAPRSPAEKRQHQRQGTHSRGGSEPLGAVSSSPRGERVEVGATCPHDSPRKLQAQAGIFPPDFLRMHVGWEPSRVLGSGTVGFLRSEARVPPGDPPGAGPSPPSPVPIPVPVLHRALAAPPCASGTTLHLHLAASPRGIPTGAGHGWHRPQSRGAALLSRRETGLCYIKGLGRCRVLGPLSPRRGKGSKRRLRGPLGRPTGPGIKFRPSRGARAPVTPATRSPLLPGFRLGPSSFLLFGLRLRRPPQPPSSLSLGAQVISPFNHEAL
eukprot:XP_022280719.1 synapsin-1-like isoform X1 [Canis lupus familiaris]